MNTIVAVDENWAIGYKGEMLYHLPSDLAYFKKNTKDKTVIMGRKTLESLPGGRPLPKRKNIVLTKNHDYAVANVVTVHSLPELFSLIKKEKTDVFNIGGDSMYKMLLPFTEKAYVTKILKTTSEADSFFPNLDDDPNWKLVESSQIYEENGIKFKYLIYENLNPLKIE